MAKTILPVLFTSAGVVFAGIVGYNIFAGQQENVSPVSSAANLENSQPAAPQAPANQNDEQVEVSSLEPEQETPPAVTNEELQVEPEASTDAENAAPEPASEDATPEPPAPVFSVLRVEPDGSAVIAGSGPPKSTITLFDGVEEIATTKSTSEGDYVFVLDKPLAIGAHELSVTAKTSDGKEVTSTETGIVHVPEIGKEQELAVLVTEPGAASRILVSPEPVKETGTEVPVAGEIKTPAETASNDQSSEESPAETAALADETSEAEGEEAVAAVEGSGEVSASGENKQEGGNEEVASLGGDAETAPKAQNNGLEVSSGNQNVLVKVKEFDPLKPTKAAEPPSVLVEAADIEGDQIFIAGTGEAGSRVNIYLGTEFLGQTQIADNGAFLFEGRRKIDAGRYKIRADLVRPNSSTVVARAEVNLVHEPEPVIAEKPKKTIALSKLLGGGTKSEPAPKPENPEVVEEQEPVDTQAQSNEPESVETASEPVSKPQNTEQETAEAVDQEIASEEDVVMATASESVALAASEPEKEIRTGAAVIIRRGDSLWRVARRNYGAGIRYTTIFEANRDQVKDPDLIYPGQVLKVPEQASGSEESSDG